MTWIINNGYDLIYQNWIWPVYWKVMWPVYWNWMWPNLSKWDITWFINTDFPKLAEKLTVIRTDRHEDLVRPKNILPVRKKSPQKFTVMCIMFSLAFLECFTLVLAIGHLISPLVFIEVKVIQFLVLSVVQNCICYVFYSVCLEFCWIKQIMTDLTNR